MNNTIVSHGNDFDVLPEAKTAKQEQALLPGDLIRKLYAEYVADCDDCSARGFLFFLLSQNQKS